MQAQLDTIKLVRRGKHANTKEYDEIEEKSSDENTQSN